jgi:DNA integrity scanning protein DisA with diadenylate cyclase activity
MLLLAMYLLAAPLPTLHLVLDKVLTGATVALSLVFQPELRKVLESLGRGSWPSRWATPDPVPGGGEEDYLDELILAVKELSQNRTGALIVIEHEQPIDQRVFTDGGVKMDAAVFLAQKIPQGTDNWLPFNDGKIDDAEGGLKWSAFIELVQHHLSSRVALKLHNDAHAGAV